MQTYTHSIDSTERCWKCTNVEIERMRQVHKGSMHECVCLCIKPNVYTGYGVKQHYLHRIIPRQLKNVYYKCILRQFEKRNCQGIWNKRTLCIFWGADPACTTRHSWCLYVCVFALFSLTRLSTLQRHIKLLVFTTDCFPPTWNQFPFLHIHIPIAAFRICIPWNRNDVDSNTVGCEPVSCYCWYHLQNGYTTHTHISEPKAFMT